MAESASRVDHEAGAPAGVVRLSRLVPLGIKYRMSSIINIQQYLSLLIYSVHLTIFLYLISVDVGIGISTP